MNFGIAQIHAIFMIQGSPCDTLKSNHEDSNR